MTDGLRVARELASRRPGSPVISLYLDLDPERFATAPARATQIRSLIDAARRKVEEDGSLSHQHRSALREDVARVERYLSSGEAPIAGARALAVFCCGPAGLFEGVPIFRPLPARVLIEPTPYVEPLVGASTAVRWCVTLANRRTARFFSGAPERLSEDERLDDDVHGQHDQGGWSQARYQRSVEREADAHLRATADELHRRWRERPFGRLALGGPAEVVPRLAELLHDDLRPVLVEERVDSDVASANDEQLRETVAPLIEREEQRTERAALDRLAADLATDGRAAGGLEQTLDSLNQRRVEMLLMDPSFDGMGTRCPRCGLLSIAGVTECPADGAEPLPLTHLREGATEAALNQGAEVRVVSRYPDLGPFGGVAALLRF